jgi:hypothetical protein
MRLALLNDGGEGGMWRRAGGDWGFAALANGGGIARYGA